MNWPSGFTDCAEKFGAPGGHSLASEVHLGALHGGALMGFACLGTPVLAGRRGRSASGWSKKCP